MMQKISPNVGDTYFELVKAFPLRRLKTDEEHDQALRVVLSFTRPGAADDPGASDYLDVLIDLIGDYEKRAGYQIDTRGVTAADIVLQRLEDRDISVEALARDAGVPADELAAMLDGTRDWSPAAADGVIEVLHINPDLFRKRMHIRSPRLANREDAARLVKKVVKVDEAKTKGPT